MPHAHGAKIDPSGHFVVNPDMGSDRIFVYRFDPGSRTLSRNEPPFIATEPGTGPRHLVFSPDGRFVFSVIELSAEVRSFRWDAQSGRLQQVDSEPLDRPDFKGVRSAAEIIVSSDGRFVYATNRARSILRVFAVDKDTGNLTAVQEIASGGIWPRNIAIDPSGRWMLCANQESKTITVFSVAANGKLKQVGEPVAVTQKPALSVFLR
jgi:6-phosphogluconolactonase